MYAFKIIENEEFLNFEDFRDFRIHSERDGNYSLAELSDKKWVNIALKEGKNKYHLDKPKGVEDAFFYSEDGDDLQIIELKLTSDYHKIVGKLLEIDCNVDTRTVVKDLF